MIFLAFLDHGHLILHCGFHYQALRLLPSASVLLGFMGMELNVIHEFLESVRGFMVILIVLHVDHSKV
jgi:hypothetical protein